MKNIKAYIGFAIDMDRAYDTSSREGVPIREDHPKYQERVKHKEVFKSGMDKLFEFFKSINAEKGATWFVNEPSFMTTKKFPEIIKKCVETGGEIGLHTHFNSSMFNSSQLTMSEDPNNWEKEGIIEPKKRLEDFLENINAKQKKVIAFKAGNHIRNKAMFEKLVEHGFEIDTTCVIKHIEIRKKYTDWVTLFDDYNITCEPFDFETKNGVIFEIPEIGSVHPDSLEKEIKLTNKSEIFLRIQLHPWQAIQKDIKINRQNPNDNRAVTLVDVVQKCIDRIKELNIPIEYVSCDEMRKIYKRNNEIVKKNINTDVNISNRYNYNELEKILKILNKSINDTDNILNYIYPEKRKNLLKTFEKKIAQKYKEDFLNDNSTHYKEMVLQERIFGTNDFFIINYIYNNFNKNKSCLDLFAGIGQSAIALNLLKFNCVGLLEFDKYRTDLANKICKEENINIKVIYDDFYNNNDVFNYDLIFSNNAVASVLNLNLDKQISIYKKFLNSTKSKDIIINAEKYGINEHTKKTNVVFYEIMSSLKSEGYVINNLYENPHFYRISNYEYDFLEISQFSEQFVNYNTINNTNIEINLYKDNQNNLFDKKLYSICINLNDKKKHPSFGLYFSFNQELSSVAKLSFFARSDKECKLKIYTGDKWVIIDKNLTCEYQLIELEDTFNFNSRSTYRIGIHDIQNINNNKIYIVNPTIKLK